MSVKIGDPPGSQKVLPGKDLPLKQIRGRGSRRLSEFSAPDKDEIIVNQLKRVKLSLNNPQFVKNMPLKVVLPPLNEILVLLGQSSLDPGDADLQLMEKFLNLWIKKYGDFLPPKGRKEMQTLRNLLGSMKMDLDRDNKESIFFGNMLEEEKTRNRWKVSLRQDHDGHETSEHENQVHCVLDLVCLNLGKIKVILSSEKNQMYCRFFSARSTSRATIRTSLSRLRDTLKKGGLKTPVFRIKPIIEEKKTSVYQKDRGIGLWG